MTFSITSVVNVFFSFLSEMRTVSKGNQITFVITSRLARGSPSLQTKSVRLGRLSSEDAKQVLLSQITNPKTQELSQADELVARCGFVPIALCIAGSLLSKAVYSEEELMKCLEEDPVNVLQTNRRPTIENSVNKSTMASMDALDDCEKQSLIVLCSFPGSFDIEAAKFVIASFLVSSITSRCSGNEPALLPGGKTEHERTAEIEPTFLAVKGRAASILNELIERCLVEKPSTQRCEIHYLIQAAAEKICGENYPTLLNQSKKWATVHFISRFADNANAYWSKDKCKESIQFFNDDRHNFEYFFQEYVKARKNKDPQIMDACETFLHDFPQKCMYLERCVLPWLYVLILEGLLQTLEPEKQQVLRVDLLCLVGHGRRKEGDQQNYENLMKEAKEVHSRNSEEFKTKPLSEVYFRNSYARFLSQRKDRKENQRIRQENEIALKVSKEQLGKVRSTLFREGGPISTWVSIQKQQQLFYVQE